MTGKNLGKPPVCLMRNCPFKMYAKISKKLIFPTHRGVTNFFIRDSVRL